MIKHVAGEPEDEAEEGATAGFFAHRDHAGCTAPVTVKMS